MYWNKLTFPVSKWALLKPHYLLSAFLAGLCIGPNIGPPPQWHPDAALHLLRLGENGLACGTLWKALSKHDPMVTPTAHGPCRSQTGPLSLFRYPGADLLHFKLNHHPQQPNHAAPADAAFRGLQNTQKPPQSHGKRIITKQEKRSRRVCWTELERVLFSYHILYIWLPVTTCFLSTQFLHTLLKGLGSHAQLAKTHGLGRISHFLYACG